MDNMKFNSIAVDRNIISINININYKQFINQIWHIVTILLKYIQTIVMRQLFSLELIIVKY